MCKNSCKIMKCKRIKEKKMLEYIKNKQIILYKNSNNKQLKNKSKQLTSVNKMIKKKTN